MAAVLLALAASASWGVSDFLGGLKTRSLNVLTVLAVSQPAGLALLAVVVLGRWTVPGGGLWILWAMLAGVGAAIGIGALYRGLAVGSMGIVAPITATAPLIPLTVALARGERPSTVQLAGIAVALVGVALAGWEPGAEGARGRAATGAGLALIAAVFFGSSQVGLEAAANVDPYWATLLLRIVSSAAVLSLPPGSGRRGPGPPGRSSSCWGSSTARRRSCSQSRRPRASSASSRCWARSTRSASQSSRASCSGSGSRPFSAAVRSRQSAARQRSRPVRR
jgi:drug/metabolite transporter (DMT)-like permease